VLGVVCGEHSRYWTVSERPSRLLSSILRVCSGVAIRLDFYTLRIPIAPFLELDRAVIVSDEREWFESCDIACPKHQP
jgi:hypothetical protein